MQITPRAQQWIEALNLQAHPEGGFYRETYRSSQTVSDNSNIIRNLATSIYFLLPGGAVSHLHRLTSDEIWYYHAGNSLSLFMIAPSGKAEIKILGNQVEKGEELQIVVPAGYIFGATCNDPDGYTLMACVVAPGFDFRDFEMPQRADLLKAFPQHAQIIEQLTVA
jgi:predicted cupin superfamily sugar epimerase